MSDIILSKTPEELKAEKIKKFNENPDAFIAIDELIMGSRRGEKGIETIVGRASHVELTLALGLMQQEVNDRINYIKMMAYKAAHQNRVIAPGNNGGFNRMKNFLNKGKGKVG